MMNWYETRMSGRVQHKGQMIPSGAKIYLSDAQKDLHNRGEEKVVRCEAPNSKDGVAVLEDWEVFHRNQTIEPASSPSLVADEDKEIPKSASRLLGGNLPTQNATYSDTTDGDSTDAPKAKSNTKQNQK